MSQPAILRGRPRLARDTVLVVPVFSEPFPEDLLPQRLSRAIERLGDLGGEPGAEGSRLQIVPDGMTPGLLVVLGLGPRVDLDAARLRVLGAAVRRAVRGLRCGRVVLDCREALACAVDLEAGSSALAEGLGLAEYSVGPTSGLSREGEDAPGIGLWVREGWTAPVQAGTRRGASLASAVNWSRRLVDLPPNVLNPDSLRERIVTFVSEAAAAGRPLRCRVLGVEELAREGMQGVLAVGSGSPHSPCLVEVTYHPGDARRRVALVGKGVTFDSGGLSLKPPFAQERMKTDMAGAATVLGVLRGLVEDATPVHVTAYLPLVENMPDGSAYRPGDILLLRSGRSVEVLNTDGEGRLILADAMDLARDGAPDVLITVATLTSACRIALGSAFTALFTSDDRLANDLEAAGARSGEPLWRLPMGAPFRDAIRGTCSDLINHSGPWAAACCGATFLQEASRLEVPWALLDVFATAWNEGESRVSDAGASGIGVRLLLDWLRAT